MKDFKSISCTKIRLERKALSETKKAIVVFHYAEKIKSDIILTFSILDVLDGM